MVSPDVENWELKTLIRRLRAFVRRVDQLEDRPDAAIDSAVSPRLLVPGQMQL